MTVQSVAATRPVRFGLRAHLLAAAGVATLVATRVYNGEAPASALKPYVVTSNPMQGDWGTQGQAGAAGVWMLHAWGDTADVVEQIVGELVVALGGERIAVEGFGHVVGFADVLDVRRDPDSTTPLYHGIVAYRWDALA